MVATMRFGDEPMRDLLVQDATGAASENDSYRVEDRIGRSPRFEAMA
jgi:hypothetical protein